MKFKKGQMVWVFCNWDRKGTCAYDLYEVMSCGAKQMTLKRTDIVEASMARHFVYAPFVNVMLANLGDAKEIAQSESAAAAKAMELAEQFRQDEIEHCNGRIAQWGGDNPQFKEAMENELAKVHEPRALRQHCVYQ